MYVSLPLNRGWATRMPILSVLILLLLTTTLAAATSTKVAVSTPVARSIPPQSIYALTPYTLVVNGSFVGENLSYSATLADGSELPFWMKLSETNGEIVMFAPAAMVGEIHQLTVTAHTPEGLSAATTFFLNVTDNSPDCEIDANTDRLGKILTCAGDTVQLRGKLPTGQYRWTGPAGFVSTEREPKVTVPGIYALTTEPDGAYSCPNSALIEVLKIADCAPDTAQNRLPNVLITTDRTSGVGPLTVRFDATNTRDLDGSVLRYIWSWEGGSATGMKPIVHFAEGEYEVILTVTDDHGARATDRITIVALPPPAYTTYWLEAECANYGDNWALVSATQASGGDYVTPMRSSTATTPADLPEHQVRFTFSDAQEGPFRLYARVNAHSNATDSYYVRINGGAWYAWKSGITFGRGFQWNAMPPLIDLQAGTNTIDFAYREAGTRLDKLFLTAEGEVPSGMGGEATNCGLPNVAPRAIAASDVIHGYAPLTVQLNGSESYDTDGQLTSYRWTWANGQAEGVNAQIDLPVGSHLVTLTVTDDEGAQDQDEVLVTVEEAVAPPTPPTSPDPMEPTETDDPAEPQGANEWWLEAECALVGSRWKEELSGQASGGKYVVVPTGNSTAAAPADLSDNQVRFTLSALTAGNYFLFARVNAPSNAADSYWVRVNGGAWYKWSNGVRRGSGFNWTKLPTALQLTSGLNSVDFAFRESGTQLDKVFVTRSSELPSGLGLAATNCETVEEAPLALEAECTLDNSAWTRKTSATAAGGTYVVHTGNRNLEKPTDSNPGDQLSYEVELKASGVHHLYLRLDAPDPSSNSIWVQVDEGEWFLFWKGADGKQLLTDDFTWFEVRNDNKAITFNLDAGHHTIRLANRESGTKVDKLLMTTDATLPTGVGPEAAACDDGSQSVGMQMMASSTTADPAPATGMTPLAEVPTMASVFPNPATTRMTLELSSAHTGAVNLIIYDMNGRRVRQKQVLKNATHFTTKLSVGSLPSGMYQLRVIEGDRATTKAFVVGR